MTFPSVIFGTATSLEQLLQPVIMKKIPERVDILCYTRDTALLVSTWFKEAHIKYIANKARVCIGAYSKLMTRVNRSRRGEALMPVGAVHRVNKATI